MIQWTNIGLWGEFEACERGILEKLNQNFEYLDALVQMSVMGFTSTLPLTPTIGDRYLLDDPSMVYSDFGSDIIVWDGEAWLHIEAKEGYIAYVLGATEGHGKFYWYNGTEWKLLELGGGSGGGKNYFPNPSFGDGMTGVTLYEETAGYVDGQGGAPTITTTIDTVTPISGDATLVIQKPAGSKINQGVSFDSDPIDLEDQGGDFYVEFTVDLRGTNYNAGDLQLKIYDVTHSVIVVPDYVRDVVSQAAFSTLDGAIFKVRAKIGSLTTTNLRASLNIANTGALAWNVGVDNVSFSPDSTAASLNELSDVTIISPVTGDLLTWDGTKWVNSPNPAITALTGDVTATGPGSVAATIANNAVTNAKAAQAPATTIKGNSTGVLANVADLTPTVVTSMLNPLVGDSGSGGTKGLVPAPASGDAAASKFLKADGTWAALSGDVAGPVVSVDNSIVRMDGVTGKVIQGTGALATIADTGEITSGSLVASKALVSGPLKEIQTSATTSTEIGYVAGLQGPIQDQLQDSILTNFLNNADANLSVSASGWTKYNESGAAYIDGTGGTSTNLTITRNTTTPLIGVADLSIAKGAANAQGEGVSVVTRNIGRAMQGQPIVCSFYVDATDANYVAGDQKFYLYDVTNSQVINISSPTSQQIVNGKYLVTFFAYPAYNCASIRLSFFTATVSALAYTIYADNFKILPAVNWQANAIVSSDTDWAQYTPTFTGFGTATGVSFRWRKSGTNMLIESKFTPGTTTAVEARVSLPPGFTSSSAIPTIQWAAESALAVNTTNSIKVLIETSQNYITFGLQNSGTSSLSKMLASNMLSSGQTISFTASIPIQGWSATSPYLITQADEFLNESMTFVQKTTALDGSEAPGTYNVYTGAANTLVTNTLSASAPTQTNADMSVNGIRIFSRNYANASTAASPARIDVVIGKGMKYRDVEAFASAGMVSDLTISSTGFPVTTKVQTDITYDPLTGILSFNAGSATSSSVTSQYVGYNPVSTSAATSGYFFIRASKKNAVTGVSPFTPPLTATSSVKTLSGNNFYAAMTGNSLTITPGNWQLTQYTDFGNNGSSPVYTSFAMNIFGANGADNTTPPLALSATPGITILSVSPPILVFPPAAATAGSLAGDTKIVKATQAVTIYAVPLVGTTGAGNARITTYLTALRLAD